MKVCTRCSKEKPYVDFHKGKKYKGGVKSYCKSCDKKYTRKSTLIAPMREEDKINYTKKCIACGGIKTGKDFYKHSSFKDGLQVRCKKCQIVIIRNRYNRFLEMGIRLNYYVKKGPFKHPNTPLSKKYKYILKYYASYPEKKAATSAVSSAKMRKSGFHAHHWSYNNEHKLDVIYLDERQHRYIHKFMSYDRAMFVYRDINGNLLDTREKHLNYINDIINFNPL